jgi:hypothetical protein
MTESIPFEIVKDIIGLELFTVNRLPTHARGQNFSPVYLPVAWRGVKKLPGE